MRVLIVGLGIQGKKRKKILSSNEYFASVDKINKSAEYKDIKQAPLDNYDTCFLCVPDSEKLKLINYCVEHNKNILVEKPLLLKDEKEIKKIQIKCYQKNLVLYTSYNHRFEPNIISAKKIIDSGKLGKIYSCKFFYGNGTSKLVRNNPWRDTKSGVLSDLGPHLMDLCLYFFDAKKINFELINFEKFENKSPDFVIIKSHYKKIYLQLEMTLCMWKNFFSCDILAQKGSLHIRSLCKWGPSTLSFRKRVLPSGKPKERIKRIIMQDPTWKLEHKYISKLIKEKSKTNFSKDIEIMKNLIMLGKKI